jgi:hypothetical protein
MNTARTGDALRRWPVLGGQEAHLNPNRAACLEPCALTHETSQQARRTATEVLKRCTRWFNPTAHLHGEQTEATQVCDCLKIALGAAFRMWKRIDKGAATWRWQRRRTGLTSGSGRLTVRRRCHKPLSPCLLPSAVAPGVHCCRPEPDLSRSAAVGGPLGGEHGRRSAAVDGAAPYT